MLKKALAHAGGFPEGIAYFEDTDTWMRIALSYDAAYLNWPLSIYHLESDNHAKFNISILTALIARWENLINNHEIPEKKEPAFNEFIVRYKLMAISNLLSGGNLRQAFILLRSIRETTIYSTQYNQYNRLEKLSLIVVRFLLLLSKFLKMAQRKIARKFGV